MSRREVDRRFDEIVEFSGVERFLDTPMKRYSSGMYLRLAFAVAAHLDADILLVDEVLAVGDAEFQRRCLGRMADVERSGRTVVFVSHNLDAIQRLCPEAVWLDEGRVVMRGPSGRGRRSPTWVPTCGGWARRCSGRGATAWSQLERVAVPGPTAGRPRCSPATSRSRSR